MSLLSQVFYRESLTMIHHETKSNNPIAIVSVHGVADQLPLDSVRQIAQMLLMHSANQSESVYDTFIEKEFHIPEQRFDFSALGTTAADSTSDQFLYKQLRDDTSKPKSLGVLKSIRLEGERKLKPRTQAVQANHPTSTQTPIEKQPIHIYEMYWADLSRLQNEFFRIFSEFYQILFHLSRLGRQSVQDLRQNYGSAPNRPFKRCWQGYAFFQTWSERALTIGFPILNIFMLVTACIIIPSTIDRAYLFYVAIVSGAIAIAVLVGELIWQNSSFSLEAIPHNIWAALTKGKSIACLLILAFGLLCIASNRLGLYHYIAALSGLILAVGALFITDRYGSRRPQADRIARIACIAWAIVFLSCLLTAADQDYAVIGASFRVIELSFIPLLLTWIVFNGAQVLAALFGIFLTLSCAPQDKNGIIYRGAWTARLSLSLSSALFLLVTMTLWYTIVQVSQTLIDVTINYQPLIPIELTGAGACIRDGGLAADCYAQKLIIAASTSFFTYVLIILALPLLVGAIALLPSIGSEIYRKTFTQDRQITHRFDRWLSTGLRSLYWATEVFTLLMILFAMIGLLLLLFQGIALLDLSYISGLAQSRLDWLFAVLDSNPLNLPQIDPENLLTILALLIASSATSLVALGSRLTKFTSGIRDLLDVILDVDNYLRVDPQGENPTARIFNRYLSLIRYLCQWRNPEQPHQQYEAIIIIAHSQGTVITADLLRVMKKAIASLSQQEPDLEKFTHQTLPIYLYTMGSPLKQLYNVAFPCLYNWMDDFQSIDEFGLRHWENVYCSGDYVGRSLLNPDTQSKPERFHEECLGAGAHTHYWDSTIPAVAESLDNRIVAVAKEQQQRIEQQGIEQQGIEQQGIEQKNQPPI